MFDVDTLYYSTSANDRRWLQMPLGNTRNTNARYNVLVMQLNMLNHRSTDRLKSWHFHVSNEKYPKRRNFMTNIMY